MDPNSYALGLISVLVGLALTDIAVSLHKLLRRKRQIRWDARVALAATFVVVLIIDMWFQSFDLGRSGVTRDFLFFLTLFLEYGLLVMAAHAVLPDGPPEPPDLARFYDEERVYLWGVLAAFEVSHMLHSAFLVPDRLASASVAWWAMFVAPLTVYLLLLLSRNRRLHVGAIALLLAATIARSQLHRLGG